MAILDDAVELAKGLLGLLLQPSVSIFWLYLLSAFVIGAAALRWRGGSRFGIGAVLGHLANRRVWGHRSVGHDTGMLLANTIAFSFLWAAPLQALSASVATWTWAQLHHGLGPLADPLSGVPLHLVATVVLFACADLAFFVAHLAFHKIPVLWSFHKVHHSARVLVPLTVFRRHPVDVLFEGALSGVVLGLAHGALGYLAGHVPSGYLIAGVNAVFFVVVVAGFNLQHSHVWMSWGPLDRIFISPAAHQIHHSASPQHVDRNFGNLLSIWDRIVGTYFPVQTRRRPGFRFGVDDGAPGHQTLFGLYLRPFFDAFRSVRARAGKKSGNGPGGGGTATP